MSYEDVLALLEQRMAHYNGLMEQAEAEKKVDLAFGYFCASMALVDLRHRLRKATAEVSHA